MSLDIYVQVQRATQEIYPNVYMQLDNLSQTESAYYGGAAPYQRFMAYALANLDIRQGDLLVDLNNIDSKTNAYTKYRVVNIPETFPDSHTELVLDLARGKPQ